MLENPEEECVRTKQLFQFVDLSSKWAASAECSTIFKSFEFSQSDSVVTAMKHICDKSFVKLTITTKNECNCRCFIWVS